MTASTERVTECPVCESTASEIAKKGRGFQFQRSWRCNTCGTVWNPGWKRSAGAIAVVTGFITTVIFFRPFVWGKECLLELPRAPDDRGGYLVPFLALPGLIIGAFLIIYGMPVVIGMVGKRTILERGEVSEKHPKE